MFSFEKDDVFNALLNANGCVASNNNNNNNNNNNAAAAAGGGGGDDDDGDDGDDGDGDDDGKSERRKPRERSSEAKARAWGRSTLKRQCVFFLIYLHHLVSFFFSNKIAERSQKQQRGRPNLCTETGDSLDFLCDSDGRVVGEWHRTSSRKNDDAVMLKGFV